MKKTDKELLNRRKNKIDIIDDNVPMITKATSVTSKKVKFKKAFQTIGKTLKYGKPYHKYLYLAILAIIISTIFELLVPIYIGKCIDNIIGIGNVDFNNLWQTALVLVGFIIISALFSWLTNYWTNLYCFKSAEYLRTIFFNKINSVPLKFIDTNQHGDLLSRMINDVDILTDGILQGLSSIINGIVTIIGTLVCMFILNVPMALVVAFITPLSLFLSLYIAKKAYKMFAAQAKNEGEINGYLEEFISGGRIVKAFNYEKQAVDDFEKINSEYYKASESAEFFSNIANPATRFINGLVYVGVGCAGTLLAINNVVSIGLISSFLNYANTFGRPFNELSVEITELQAAFASADRIFAVLEAEDEKSDENLPEMGKADGNIIVKNAYFSYVPKVKLIKDFNLDVKKGQKIAIVGPTGCGKTTFINLLMRFYDLTDGTIMLDGNVITQVKRNSWRKNFGMVLQDTWLFSATIKENLAYGCPNATDEDIIKICKLTGVHDFVEKLPSGYNTMVTEGGNNISQGQRQLICIARIMLMEPSILILDEATSNIDTRSEIKIQKAFDLMMEGRTTFIVAHRLSTIKNADLILVMNKGNIIEQGTHIELLQKHGFYYHLYNSQFEKVTD